MFPALRIHIAQATHRASEDIHHIGIAVLPFLLSREFLLAFLSVVLVMVLFLLQSVVTGGAAALAVMPAADLAEGAEDTP